MKGRNRLPLALSATLGTAGIACAGDDQPITAEEIAVRNAGGPGEMEFDRYEPRRNAPIGQHGPRGRQTLHRLCCSHDLQRVEALSGPQGTLRAAVHLRGECGGNGLRRQDQLPGKPIVKLRRVIPLRCDDLRARSSRFSPSVVRTPEGQANPHQRRVP
jgi:hypothetical protein